MWTRKLERGLWEGSCLREKAQGVSRTVGMKVKGGNTEGGRV